MLHFFALAEAKKRKLPGSEKLLPSVGCQCFYDDDVWQLIKPETILLGDAAESPLANAFFN
jgi:hypothetical protein